MSHYCIVNALLKNCVFANINDFMKFVKGFLGFGVNNKNLKITDCQIIKFMVILKF